MDAGVVTPQCPHLSSHFCISNTINLIRVLICRRFRSGRPQNHIKHLGASKTYLKLSKHALNRQTVSTSTTELDRLFQILTIRAVKEYFRVS